MILEKILAALERLIPAVEANTAAQAGDGTPKKTRAQKALETVTSPSSPPATPTAPVTDAPAPTTVPAAASPVTTSASAGDMKELSPLITQLAKTRRDDAVAILKGFGAGNARELKPEHIAPAIEAFKKALAQPVAASGSDLV